jgi:hypothetical protein
MHSIPASKPALHARLGELDSMWIPIRPSFEHRLDHEERAKGAE